MKTNAKIVWITAGIVAAAAGTAFVVRKKRKPPKDKIEYYNNLIITTAMKQGVPEVNAKLLAAQSAHETGNFSSNAFNRNNNAFGMAVPRVRKSPYIVGPGSVSAPVIEGGFSYAAYKNIEDSVKDVIHWLNYNKVVWNQVNTPEKYDAFLYSKGYHTASQSLYTAALNRYYEKIKNMIVRNPKTSVAIAIAGTAMISAGVYFYLKGNNKKAA
jgi:hypothetical protein